MSQLLSLKGMAPLQFGNDDVSKFNDTVATFNDNVNVKNSGLQAKRV